MEGKGRRRNAPHGAYIPGSGCRSFGCFCWIFSSSKTWLQVWRSEDDGEHHHRGRNRLFLVSRSRIPNHQTSTSLLTFYIYIYIYVLCILKQRAARPPSPPSSRNLWKRMRMRKLSCSARALDKRKCRECGADGRCVRRVLMECR